ncbi:MAG: PD-(D/E)XK nuclease family protein [Candidatus Shikimatogenerans bostrichidophilus]|nr:MAG: PD-(D/E)XK nuclease family protein [Candidatus Shikimatogenerans bostrichidophilus]
MINFIKKKIKEYINKKKKYIFVLPNKYYKDIIKKIYIKYTNKKIGIIPNIFYTKKELIESISNLKITNDFIYFIKVFMNILLLVKYKINNYDIIFFFKLLNDLKFINTNLINLKLIIKNYFNYYKISKWYPDKNKNIKNNIKKYLLLYKKFNSQIYINKKVSYEFALKIAYRKINSFKKRINNNKIIFIGKILVNKLEKKIKNKLNNLSKFYYSKKQFYNKKNIIKTDTNINKYLFIKKRIKKNKKVTIIFTNNKIDNTFLNFFKNKNLFKINFNLFYYYNELPIHSFLKNFLDLLKYNFLKIEYNLFFDFIYNNNIKFFLSNKHLIKIYKVLENKMFNKYITLNIKLFKYSIFYKILTNLNKVDKFLLNFKKIIKILLKNNKNNIIDYIYLKNIKRLINFLYSIKSSINLNNIYTIFNLYIFYNNSISLINVNLRSNIEIINFKSLYEENIVNYNNYCYLILNKNYNLLLESNLNYFITNKINYRKYYLNYNKIKKILNLFKNVYIVYNNNDILFNKNNLFILLNIFINNKYKIFKYRYYNNYIYKINKKIDIKFNYKKKIYNYIIEKGFNYTSLRYLLMNKINFFYKYILDIKKDESNEPKIFGKIIHKILYILYNKYINLNFRKSYIYSIIKKIKKGDLIKSIYNKYYNKIYINFNFNYKLIKKIILKFIYNDYKLINKGDSIKLLYLEKFYKIKLINNIIFTGKIDRIELLNNNYRIIDYKTYSYIKNRKNFNYKNNNDIKILFTNEIYSNILQLLLYTLIFTIKNNIKYNFFYLSIYYPNIIINIKINNSIKITNNFIKEFKDKLYDYILNIYKINFNYNISYFKS